MKISETKFPSVVPPRSKELNSGSNVSFLVAAINLTVNLESLENWHKCPPTLSSFITSLHDEPTGRLSFKWRKDDDFCLHKIYDRSYSDLRIKWLECFNDGNEQIFSHIINDKWTVFFSSEREHALGIGPEHYFFDIFTSALDLAYIKLSMENNLLPLHSSGIIVAGYCLLFLAKSNTGKTTLSKRAIKNGYDVLSDDRVFVMHDANGFTAHGTPFGKIGRNKGGYPIGGVFAIEQSDQNLIEPISKIDFFKKVWFNEYDRRRRCFGGVLASNFFSQLMDFLDYHPLFRLKFKNDFDDWEYMAQVVESSINSK